MSKDFGKNNSNIITNVRIKVNGVYATQPIALYNYFAYGMPKTDANDYAENISLTTNIKYGFNNQLREDDLAGIGNHNTALYWEYDTRLGRRWNLDPVPQLNISDYATFGNNPIIFNDMLGDKIKFKGKEEKKDVNYLKKHDKNFAEKWKSIKKEYGGKDKDLTITKRRDAKTTLNDSKPTDAALNGGNENKKAWHLDYTAIEGAHQGTYSVLEVNFTALFSLSFMLPYKGSTDVNSQISSTLNKNIFLSWEFVNRDKKNDSYYNNTTSNLTFQDANNPFTIVQGTITTRGDLNYQKGVLPPPQPLTVDIIAISKAVILKVPRSKNGKCQWNKASPYKELQDGETPEPTRHPSKPATINELDYFK